MLLTNLSHWGEPSFEKSSLRARLQPAVNLEPESLSGLGSRHHADVSTIQHTELIVLLRISLMTASACETRQMSSCVPAILEP